LLRHPRHALCCLSPAFSARWSCRFCRRLASIHGLGAFELLGSGRAIRTGGLRHLRLLSEPAVSAISSPNRAATSVSLSTLAAPGVSLDSGRSCPAPAISSFSSTPREAHRIAFVPWRELLCPFRSHLRFEIGTNVLTSGECHHLTILISTLCPARAAPTCSSQIRDK